MHAKSYGFSDHCHETWIIIYVSFTLRSMHKRVQIEHYVRVDNPEKHFFFCESDLHKKLGPRPSEYFYKAKEICEKANSSLATSLEPNFDFESQI